MTAVRLNAASQIVRAVNQRRRCVRFFDVLTNRRYSVATSRSNSASNFMNSSELFSQNKKLSFLVRSGRVHEARSLFDKFPHRNAVTWNIMMSGYVKRREITKARQLFDAMPEKDVASWNTMISGYLSCGGSSFFEEARLLFDEMPERNSISWNTMISGYAKNRRMDDALRIFHTMPEKNVVSWNAVITGFLSNDNVANAIEFFRRMPVRNSASLSALVSGLIQNDRLDEAARILQEFETGDGGKEYLVDAYNTLIAGYGQKGRVEDARQLFDQMPCEDDLGEQRNGIFNRNLVSWNTMIMCYTKAGDIVSARELFDKMVERDIFTWNTMISGYIHISDIQEASHLFSKMPDPDALSWNSMILGFAQMGSLQLARDYFEKMPFKTLVSWNSIIAGYEKNEDYIGALKLFIRMQTEGEKPDRHTLSSILSACTGLVNLQLGIQIHQLVEKTFIPDVPLNNSLVTMYSRCGAIAEGRSIFDKVKTSREIISWNAMIGGYASHGFAAKALELFDTMKHNNIQPTYITFISVLNACAHSGRIDEGRRHFKSMITEYGIQARIEHYASLVDMVARHGLFQEAINLIKGMPLEPDKAVWGALLNACRLHNNVELARVAADALTMIEPESPAPYVLLYNMYADAGRWDDAGQVRDMMDINKVKKHAARSWIE